MLSKKNHIINYFKEVKYISDQIGISKIDFVGLLLNTTG